MFGDLPSLETHLLRAKSALFAARIIALVIGRLIVERVIDDLRRPFGYPQSIRSSVMASSAKFQLSRSVIE